MKKMILMAAVMLAAAGAGAQGWDGSGAAAMPEVSVIRELAAKTGFTAVPAPADLPAAGNPGALARVTVCPKDQRFIKSETVTLTADAVTFDIVSGPWNLKQGAPAGFTLSYKVISIKPAGLLKRGFEVKFYGHDSAGQTIETVRIYSDSTNDADNGDLTAAACSAR